MLVYSSKTFVPATRATNWYDWYERSAICGQCGKEIGKQTSLEGDEFYFNEREKSKYTHCPYCGEILYKEERK